jgi:predicted RNase H-like HicB family nuclease
MSTTTDGKQSETVEITYEDNTDLVTAKDIQTGVASSGHSKVEALVMLAEALELHHRDSGPVTDEEENEILREIRIDPNEIEEDPSPPPWLE